MGQRYLILPEVEGDRRQGAFDALSPFCRKLAKNSDYGYRRQVIQYEE